MASGVYITAAEGLSGKSTVALGIIDVWAWRARHFLGAYTAQLGGVDAVTFAGGDRREPGRIALGDSQRV